MFTKNRKSKTFRYALTLVLIVGTFGFTPVPSAQASTFTVVNVNDSGVGSLRQAIANASSGDTITFDLLLSGQTILLSTPITISKRITIDGTSLDTDIQISGGGAVPVFYVNSSSFTLKDLNIINGGYSGLTIDSYGTMNLINVDFMNNSTPGSYGGAIWNSFGTLNITNGFFSGNSGGQGGAIYNGGTLTIKNTVFTDNSSSNYGGAIANSNRMTIIESTFSNNHANWGGGAIYNRIASDIAYANIIGSTIVDNSSDAGGGGILNEGNTSMQSDVNNLTITNTTISSNVNTGITNIGGFLVIKNSTIVNNSRLVDEGTGSGLSSFGPIGYENKISISNSIFANNTNGPDCYTDGIFLSVVSIGNLIENNGNGVNACGSPTITSDPNLGPVADNGGSTQTRALLSGSPAIDAGDDANCPVMDQRGVARPQGSGCDIGAYEFERDMIDVTIGGLPMGRYYVPSGAELHRCILASTTDRCKCSARAEPISSPASGRIGEPTTRIGMRCWACQPIN